MADKFASFSDTPGGSSRAPFAIVPHDANELASVPKGIYVGGAGNITLRGIDAAADVVFVGVPVGMILDVRASHVRSTGTTATNLVALA